MSVNELGIDPTIHVSIDQQIPIVALYVRGVLFILSSNGYAIDSYDYYVGPDYMRLWVNFTIMLECIPNGSVHTLGTIEEMQSHT